MAINYLPEDEEDDMLSVAPAPRRRLPGEKERGAFDVPVGQVGPDWLAAITEPSGTMPVSGGPVFDASDILPSIPQSKEELALQAAAMLAPGLAGRAAKAAAPALSKALGKRAPAFLKGLTPQAILEKAAKPASIEYADFVRKNPEAGKGFFGDLREAQPAITGRPMLPRPPGTRKPSARVIEAMANPEVPEKMIQNVEAGIQKMPESWYRTSPLYRHYQEKYGDQAAKLYETLMGMVGASSTRNPVPSNIKAGSYYNYLARTGQKIPDKPAKGYGHLAQRRHVAQARRIAQQGSLDPLQNPKPSSFVENLLGNEQPMTVDTHEWRQLGMAAKDPRFLVTRFQAEKGGPVVRPRQMYKSGELSMEEALNRPVYWESVPKKTEYGLYEQLAQPTVQRSAQTPANFQGYKWIGAGGETGLASPDEAFLTSVAKRIFYTAMRMGEDPVKVLDHYVKGGPLLGVAGAAAGLSALPDEEEPADDGLQY